MASLKFRFTRIDLDEEEDVHTAVAVVRSDVFTALADLVPGIEVLSDDRGGTEKTVLLSWPQLLDLYRQVGKIPTGSPRYRAAGGGDVYDSLSRLLNWADGE